MQKLVEALVEVDRKMVPKGLPATLTLYALDADHFILTAARSRPLAQKALAIESATVSDAGRHYQISLPKRIYEFYRLAENDYTVMVSQQTPVNIVVSI
jgi:hypothetical protein